MGNSAIPGRHGASTHDVAPMSRAVSAPTAHVGEPASLVHEANHLMAGTGEFRNFLQEFRKHFIPA